MKNEIKLNQIVVDVEFLLISVIQGVALAALAASSISPITNFQIQYWPYIVSGFLLILIFWAQAIMHVLSFVRWPLSMTHNFLYFLASLVEVMIFSQMTSPAGWFAFYLAFVVVSAILYYYDLLLIKQGLKGKLSEGQKNLFTSTLKEQRFELWVFVPLGILFNLGALVLIYAYPKVFIDSTYHIFLALAQIIFAFFILVWVNSGFKKRLRLIENTVE